MNQKPHEKPQRYAIVGMKHRGTEALVDALASDAPVTLVREAGNKYDRNAVQVWATDNAGTLRHVGYIPKTQNQVLARFIDLQGQPWGPPAAVATATAFADSASMPKAVAGRVHKGSNTYPLVEVV